MAPVIYLTVHGLLTSHFTLHVRFYRHLLHAPNCPSRTLEQYRHERLMKKIPAFMSRGASLSRNENSRNTQMEVTDSRLLEDLGRAKGGQVIEKTLEAVQKSPILKQKFRKLVEELKLARPKNKLVLPVPLETKHARLASIKLSAEKLNLKIQQTQAQKKAIESLAMQRKIASLNRREIVKRRTTLIADFQERRNKMHYFAKCWTSLVRLQDTFEVLFRKY